MDFEQRGGHSDRRRVIRGGRRQIDHAAVVRALEGAQTRLPDHAPTALVVDNVQDGREMMREYLHFWGFRVDEAASGTEALEKARTLIPDVVLLDVVLPDMDGIELIARLRQNTPVKVAVLTGHVFDDARARALAAGAAIFIPKPCDLEMVALQLAWLAGAHVPN